MNRNSAVLVVIAISIFSFVAASPSTVSANWLLDRSGTLMQIDPRILGDDDTQENEVEDESDDVDDDKDDDANDDVDDDKGDDSKGSVSTPQASSNPSVTSTQTKEQKRAMELNREKEKKDLEAKKRLSEIAKKAQINMIKNNEIKAIKNETETESEIEVEGDKLKIKQKIKDASGREIEKKIELKAGEELEIESQDGDEKKKFKLKADGTNSLAIEKDGVTAKSNLPITVNENNELVVTHPDGTTKIVAFMPDQALKMLKELNITPIVPGSADDTLEDNMPVLEDEDGESVYKIDGQKEEKILGLFKVAYKTKAVVSAENGELIRTELSGLDRFLSIFSF